MGNTTSHKTSRRIIDGDGKYAKNLSIVAELEKSGFFKELAATYR